MLFGLELAEINMIGVMGLVVLVSAFVGVILTGHDRAHKLRTGGLIILIIVGFIMLLSGISTT